MTRAGSPQALLLKHARILNVRGFQDVDISFEAAGGKPRGMTLILGNNGSGKSTLLRALAIGLCQQREASSLAGRMAGEFIRINKKGNRANQAQIDLELVDPEDRKATYSIRTVVSRSGGQEILTKETVPEAFPWESIFVFGYGVNRGTGKRAESPPATYSRPEALSTLFDDNATLLDPEDTLRALRLAASESAVGKRRFDEVLLDLKALLELKPSHKIDVNSVEVRIHGPWGSLPFHALGDGYRGTAGWFLDFCRRAHIANRNPDQAGIILIDEIDEHLHPAWQKRLVPLLKKRLSNLQFVGTTHSAMSIVNTKPQELFATWLENTVATVKPLDSPEGKTADFILRGEWFGLDSTLDTDSEAVLQKYQDAVTARKPERQIAELRDQVRSRIGRLAESPVDQLAIQIANEARRSALEESSPEDRQQRLAAAARELRQRLKIEGNGP